MPSLDDCNDADFKESYQTLGGNFSALATHFTSSAYHIKKRIQKLGLGEKPAQKKPRTARPKSLGDVAQKHAPDPIIDLLRKQRAEGLALIARIDKTLAAYSE